VQYLLTFLALTIKIAFLQYSITPPNQIQQGPKSPDEINEAIDTMPDRVALLHSRDGVPTPFRRDAVIHVFARTVNNYCTWVRSGLNQVRERAQFSPTQVNFEAAVRTGSHAGMMETKERKQNEARRTALVVTSIPVIRRQEGRRRRKVKRTRA
jgi:hypothetical protein